MGDKSDVRATDPPGTITMRRSIATDSAFLLQLFATSAEEELSALGWTVEGQPSAVIMQAQTWEWRLSRRFPQLMRMTIRHDGERVGRLLMNRGETCVDLVDIFLTPGWRRRGIATHVIGELIAEATVARIPLRMRIPADSTLTQFCERLGFTDPEPSGNDLLLTWTPPSLTSPRDEARTA